MKAQTKGIIIFAAGAVGMAAAIKISRKAKQGLNAVNNDFFWHDNKEKLKYAVAALAVVSAGAMLNGVYRTFLK